MVGVIGPPGVGKSTIMNELYGFDATSPGEFSIFVLLITICFLLVYWGKRRRRKSCSFDYTKKKKRLSL